MIRRGDHYHAIKGELGPFGLGQRRKVAETVADDDVAHAVGDEAHRLHAVEMLQHARERVGMRADLAHR